MSFESIHNGVSEGVFPFGNRYSSKLHFGISKVGNGEEKGMVAAGEGAFNQGARNVHYKQKEGRIVLRQQR